MARRKDEPLEDPLLKVILKEQARDRRDEEAQAARRRRPRRRPATARRAQK